MNNILIFLFILVANVVAILLTYYSFDKKIEKNKRLLYTMIALGVMYILVLIVYFFSSIGMPKETTEQSKDMITFSFVPVNAILLVPFLLRSFNLRKDNSITSDQLNKRAIIVFVLGIVLLVGEGFYFRNIENGINDIIKQKQNEKNSVVENETSNIINTQDDNTIENSIGNNLLNEMNANITY